MDSAKSCKEVLSSFKALARDKLPVVAIRNLKNTKGLKVTHHQQDHIKIDMVKRFIISTISTTEGLITNANKESCPPCNKKGYKVGTANIQYLRNSEKVETQQQEKGQIKEQTNHETLE